MDLNTRLDAAAGALARDYQFILSAFVAAFARVLDTTNPTAPMVRYELDMKLLRYGRDFYSELVDSLLESVASLAEEALDASQARLDSDMRVFLDALLQDELGNVLLQVQALQIRDRAKVVKVLHDLALEVNIKVLQGASPVSAMIQAKHGKVSHLKFVQADRSGRSWSSVTFLKTIIRHFLLKVYVETFLFGKASTGSDLVKVVYPDPSHAKNGLVISIGGNTAGYPRYVDIEDEIFHPNSSASVEAV